MTVEKGLRPTSPVHVHVEDDIPVHVHVKKPKKSSGSRKLEDKLIASSYGSDNLRTRRSKSSSTAARGRSKSPGAGPWIPAPGKTTKGSKLTWDGPSHRLEISTPRDKMHMSELDTEEEELVHGHMKNYEKKIDSLMSEVGTLKNEVELQRSFREIEKKDELLDMSRKIMTNQEHEIEDVQHELSSTEKENRILRKSMELLQDDASFCRTDPDILSGEREKLMKKLIEVELDGQAAAKQVDDYRDALRRQREETRMSKVEGNRFARQRDVLMDKLACFEATNRTLRRLLRDQHQHEAAAIRVAEQRDLLLQKLTASDRNLERSKGELFDRELLVDDLRKQLAAQKDETLAVASLQNSLEVTRGHLQKQLRTKEADCNRMAVQIRRMENQVGQDKIDVDHLQELLATARDKADHDKEALKRATRVQKQRASRSEDAVEQLNAQLLERETRAADLQNQTDMIRAHFDKLSKEKAHIVAENSGLAIRVSELEQMLERVEDTSKIQTESASIKILDREREVADLLKENEKLRSSVSHIESKLSQADDEVSQVRSNLKQYETLVEEYRSQMNKSRREADDSLVRLEDTQKENSRISTDKEAELEKVKARLHQRLQELEPLPELLKSTELKLQDGTERMAMYERKNTENTKLITELTTKIESQTDQLDQMRARSHDEHDEKQHMSGKMDSIERKLRESEDQIRELHTMMTKRDDSIHQLNHRLEEKSQENVSLTRQLENALSDMKRQSEQARDRTASKERTLQTRIMDLESQLSQSRAEIARIKREKEENERKANSRLYDLKDRLEQSHSTNRSMQNYVQFLKNSYANVFGDSSIGAATPTKSFMP